VNGHTDQITRDYYLLLSRIEERKGTERFAQLMRGEQIEEDIYNENETADETAEQMQFEQACPILMPYYLTNYCHYSQLKLTLTSIAASGG
jgi:hypothetical protein